VRGPIRGVLRYSTRDLIVAAVVAIASFGAGLAWSAAADARESEPELDAAKCASDCDGKAASVGSTVELTGSGLEAVEVVKFASDEEKRVKAKPEDVSDEVVEVVVPEGAVTGKPRVVDSERDKATAPKDLEIADSDSDSTETPTPTDPGEPTDPSEPTDPAQPDDPNDPTGPGTGDAPGDTSPDGISVDPDKGFFKGKRSATAHVSGGSVSELEVVAADTGEAVATVPVKDDGAGEAVAKWNGVTDAGEVAANGDYEYRAAAGGDSATFEQYDHIFPVNGKHDYGDGIGAGRGHQGQDVFADCGTKMVAARAGKVESVAFHDAAGNYLVIDGKKTDADYAYMHLEDAPLVAEGDKVKTGEAIGHVGETGNASGCHLHFELWGSGYQQGEPSDPTPELKKWDEWS
jgi:murein DD-endopeptidase MepM/ murein hydrolase activator NlpD